MFRKLKFKLRGKRGESLTEVLIAVLISSIALVMLASMIATTQRIVTRTKASTEEYVTGNNKLVEKEETSKIGTGNVQFVAGVDKSSYYLTQLTDNTAQNIPVQYYVNSALKNVLVAAYEKGGGT